MMPKLNAKILVVYDDESVRTSLTPLMEEEGFRVLQASNGKMGLDVIRTALPDLMLVEIKVSDLDGINVLREARNFNSNLHIIAITAYRDSHGAARALEVGADGYLAKPFPIREVIRVVHRALAKRNSGLPESKVTCWNANRYRGGVR
jgi:DNA-binding response OmpR family regulator